MLPIGPSLSKTSSASSPTLWAMPSKEWVIPAKPKPGRKPKKESSSSATTSKDDEDNDSFGRRVQNRAAQRAFRERRQSQLAELQARLHSYEQGEIERNIALQNIAKRMKEENEQLRKENHILKEKVTRLECQLEEAEQDKKRLRDDPTTRSYDAPSAESQRKRARMDEDAQAPPFGARASTGVSPSLDEGIQTTALSLAQDEISPHFPAPAPPVSETLTYAGLDGPSISLDSSDDIDSFQCVLCSPSNPCVCREMTLQQGANEVLVETTGLESLSDKLGQHSVLTTLDQSVSPPSINILENLPAYQAPVPLRRRSGGTSVNAIFPVVPLTSTPTSSTPRCSGDPNNCMACADDNFGRAFCQAINHSMVSSAPCPDCPRRTSQADKILLGGCCGDVSKCGSCGIAPIISSANSSRRPETIPTDDAWRQLKTHPNVAFADLTLLAEVVARRSKCTGSRVVISPAPGSITPERSTTTQHDPNNKGLSVLPTDPHERLHRQQLERNSPPRLVPQDVLIECGRRRVREVNADGVREALRLLDSKFAHARP